MKLLQRRFGSSSQRVPMASKVWHTGIRSKVHMEIGSTLLQENPNHELFQSLMQDEKIKFGNLTFLEQCASMGGLEEDQTKSYSL